MACSVTDAIPVTVPRRVCALPMFFATGLLGPSPATSSEQATVAVLESTFTFVSTGLLDERPSSTEGGCLTTESTPSEANGVCPMYLHF